MGPLRTSTPWCDPAPMNFTAVITTTPNHTPQNAPRNCLGTFPASQLAPVSPSPVRLHFAPSASVQNKPTLSGIDTFSGMLAPPGRRQREALHEPCEDP